MKNRPVRQGDLLFQLARMRSEACAVEKFQALVQGETGGKDEAAALVRLAVDNGVAPLLFRQLRKSAAVPRDLLGLLLGAYFANVRWNQDSLSEISRIIELLRPAGIDAIPLKGAVGALSLLGDEGLYAGSDIDLLVRRERLEDAVRVLRTAGYVDSHAALDVNLQASYHHSLTRGAFHVEVHWNLVRPPFEADPGFWWEDAAPCGNPAGTAWALSAEKYLLYLIYRLYSHGFSPLRFFVLPVEIANGRAGPVDWRRLLDFARRCRMERLTRFALAFMKDRLGAAVPEEVAAPGRGNRRLHERIAEALTGGDPIGQLTRLRLYTLFDTPGQALRMVVRKTFPPAAEIRWRYGVKDGGWKLPVLYLLNPVLVLIEVGKRQQLVDRFIGRD